MQNTAFILTWILAIGGCLPLEIDHEKREIAGAREHLTELEFRVVPELEQKVLELENTRARIEAHLRSTQTRLATVKQKLVDTWHGHPPALEKSIDDAKPPPPLAEILRAAQRELGRESVEQRFILAMARKDLAAVATTLEGWEVETGYTEPPAELFADEEKQGETCACRLEKLEYRCAPRAGAGPDRRWMVCAPLGETPAEAWMFGEQDGAPRRWSVGTRNQERVNVDRVLGDKLALLSGERKIGTNARWLEVWSLAEREATKYATLPLALGDKEAAVAFVDLDGDGNDDLLHRVGKRLSAWHLMVAAAKVEVWGRLETCARLGKIESPEAKPFSKLCAVDESKASAVSE